MFTTEMSEREIVNSVRNLFKAHIPESNAWAEPNHLSITAQVFGGLAFSALSEARNGIDARVMVDTAEGAYLDAIAARPPYNTTRLPASFAEGVVYVVFAGVDQILSGDTLTRSDGATYTVLCDTDLDADGKGQVKVRADQAGPSGNAVYGYPFTDSRGVASVDESGLGGGRDIECDDGLRDRLYSYQPGCQFGSLTSIEDVARGLPGVRSAKACKGVTYIDLFIAMKDGPVPTQVDIDAVQAAFDDPCRKLIGPCVRVRPVIAESIIVRVSNPCPSGISSEDMSVYLSAWLVSNAEQGQGFTGEEIRAVLREGFPSVAIQTDCTDYPSSMMVIYTSAEVVFE